MDKSNFFIHITDLHLQNEKDIGWHALEKFVEQVLSMKHAPDFIINTGDTIFASMRIESELNSVKPDFERYAAIMSKLPMPVYHVVGNHDMTLSEKSPGSGAYGKELFEKYCGPRYQSFDYGKWHCVIIDEWIVRKKTGVGVDNIQNELMLTRDIDQEQLDWLKNDLSQCTSDKTILLFIHNSLLNNQMGGLPDNQCFNILEKILPIVPPSIRVIEVAGCNHMNTSYKKANWQFITTASFCGGWWSGNCIDGNKPGYALMFDNDQSLSQYYRPLDEPLAVASPTVGQIVTDKVLIDAFEPEIGKRKKEYVDVCNKKGGWGKIDICLKNNTQSVDIFSEPQINNISVNLKVYLEFELVQPPNDTLSVHCNSNQVGQLNSKKSGLCSFDISKFCSLGWNKITMVGDAVIRSPRLLIGSEAIEDPRVSWFESFRPEWFEGMDILKLCWDTSTKKPKTPARYPGNEFYFNFSEER